MKRKRKPQSSEQKSVGGLSGMLQSPQGLFSNPLATPDTLGVASGASFGAVLGLLMHGNLILVQMLALIFGIISCIIT